MVALDFLESSYSALEMTASQQKFVNADLLHLLGLLVRIGLLYVVLITVDDEVHVRDSF